MTLHFCVYPYGWLNYSMNFIFFQEKSEILCIAPCFTSVFLPTIENSKII